MTIKRHSSTVKLETVYLVYLVYLVCLVCLVVRHFIRTFSYTPSAVSLQLLPILVRAIVDAHREFPIHRLVAFQLGIERPLA